MLVLQLASGEHGTKRGDPEEAVAQALQRLARIVAGGHGADDEERVQS